MRRSSASVGAFDGSLPGTLASFGILGAVPAMLSFNGRALGPVLIFSRSSAMALLLVSCGFSDRPALFVPGFIAPPTAAAHIGLV